MNLLSRNQTILIWSKSWIFLREQSGTHYIRSFIPLSSVTQSLLYDMMSPHLNADYSKKCVIRALQSSAEASHALESAIFNHHRKLDPKFSEWLAHFNLQENVYDAAFKKANYYALMRVVKLSDVEVK